MVPHTMPDSINPLHNKYQDIGISDEFIDKSYKRLGRHEYFLRMAQVVSLRSHDSQTVHGAVFVKDDRVISTGYNGFPAGMPDEYLPNVRDQKYKFINHAEENAVYAAASLGVSLKGATAYITGIPCSNCARILISVGIKKWFIGNKGHKRSREQILLTEFWIEQGGVEVVQINIDN